MINNTNKLDFNCKDDFLHSSFFHTFKNKIGHKNLFIIFLIIIIIEILTLYKFNSNKSENTNKKQVQSLNNLITEYENSLETPVELPKPKLPIEEITKKLTTKSIKVKTGDNLTDIFTNLNLPINDLYQILKINNLQRSLKHLQPGQVINFTLVDNQLTEIIFNINNLKQLILTKENNVYSYKYISKTLEPRIKSRKLTIKSSLYDSIIESKLPIHFLIKIADIFSWDIDFTTDIRTNDTITLLYEEMYLGDQKYSYGDILAIKFKNNKNTYHAIKYINGKVSAYYTKEGYNLKKAFIRTPVKYTRISSYFTIERHHPILHKIRSHKGVDYAAPYGTPIKAAGDGKVQYIGRKGGYGKTIMLQHGNNYTTLYGHLSKYKKGLKNNKSVKQGDIIGYVGSTGLATGPHLHFEFRVHGIHKDPLTVKLPRANPIAKKIKDKFFNYTNEILAKLDNIENKHNSETKLANNNEQQTIQQS